MRHISIVITALLLLLFIQPLFASETSNGTNAGLNNYIGIVSGVTTGVGLSYRYWTGSLGFEITGTYYLNVYGIYFGQFDNFPYYEISIGFLGGMYNIDPFRIYININLEFMDAVNYPAGSFQGEFAGGAIFTGIGFEYILSRNISLDLKVGIDTIPLLVYQPAAGISVYYSF
jgi:hypothetical protein